MAVSKEAAIAELKRRGVPIPNQQPRISKEEAMAELKRRGVPIPGQNWYDPVINSISSGAIGFKKGVEDVTHGILQPIAESGYLGENIKRGSQEVAKNRQREFDEASRRDPLSSMAGNILGGAAITAPAAAATGGFGAFSRAPGFLKYLKTILGGAASGALGGGAQYTNPGESRGTNALAGGLIGAGLGSLGAGASAGYNAVSGIAKAFPAKKAAQSVLDRALNVEKQYKAGYKNLFKESKGANIKLNVPKIREKPIIEEMTKKESKYIRKFLNPESGKYGNPETGHKAASDLGKTIRRLEKRKEGIVGLNSAERKALDAARDAQKKIRSSLGEGFEAAGRLDLAKTYSDLTAGFGKDVIPYRTNAAINKFKRGELKDKDFLKALTTDKKFQATLGHLHPELQTRKRVGLAAKYALPSIGGTGGGLYLLNKLGMFEK